VLAAAGWLAASRQVAEKDREPPAKRASPFAQMSDARRRMMQPRAGRLGSRRDTLENYLDVSRTMKLSRGLMQS